MTPGLMTALLALIVGTFSVILAILAIRWLDRSCDTNRSHARNKLNTGPEPIIFLFRNNNLIDATAPARSLMSNFSGPGDDFSRLTPWLVHRFPDLHEALKALAARGQIELRGAVGTGNAALRLSAVDLGENTTRITVIDPTAENAGIVIDSLTLQTMEEELYTLRASMAQAPMLAWRQDQQGQITWANAAYTKRADEILQGEISWPLPRLIELPSLRSDANRSVRRAQLDTGSSVLWFDCHAHRSGDQTMFFAMPADAAVRAERGLRDFVQTLTKTFADLPTGLAIFDRERNLQLFNPALIDLTGLPAGFLTARPTLFDFLDKLRETRMIPEPKDYRSWRQQMNNLEMAAATGRHVETWSLPGGQTHRVTGRPHPDGAVAFVFEDITSEISLMRKFRAELNLGALVLDGIEEGLAVFGPNGQLMLFNKAYENIWGIKEETLQDALDHWRKTIDAGPGFEALQARLTATNRETLRNSGAMSSPDGRMIGWSVRTLGGGRQLVRFLPSERADLPLSQSHETTQHFGNTVADSGTLEMTAPQQAAIGAK